MEMVKILIMALAFFTIASIVTPAGAFIGAGVNLNKHLGDTIDFDLNPTLVQAAESAYGLADMDLGVSWGVDYDISALAGYPYGYGGVGAVTDANIGYSLGLSLDETHGARFDGSAFGVPLTEGSLSTTKYNNVIARNDHLSDVQVALPFY
jgi:hypothetical protein